MIIVSVDCDPTLECPNKKLVINLAKSVLNKYETPNGNISFIFGSDESAVAIQVIDHKPESLVFSFVDKKSEAWITPGLATDDVLKQLLRVFSIYGKAGCTSPAKLVLIDQSTEDSSRMSDGI